MLFSVDFTLNNVFLNSHIFIKFAKIKINLIILRSYEKNPDICSTRLRVFQRFCN